MQLDPDFGPRWATLMQPQEGTMTGKKIPAPDTLGDAGTSLWGDVTGKWDLRPDELAILTRACRTADLLEVMEAAWAADPRMMVRGSQGQEVINPVLAEMRQYGSALNTLLKSLRLPDETDTPEARSTAARAAANARWSRRGA